jgi:hypothetical protein
MIWNWGVSRHSCMLTCIKLFYYSYLVHVLSDAAPVNPLYFPAAQLCEVRGNFVKR